MTIQNELEGMKLPIPSMAHMTSVPEYFKGKHVFVTGATGFMGKVLIEKLLWSCSGIGNIYILVRVKKGVHPETRIKELLKLPVFDRLRENNPGILSKIKPIVGDVMEENLGLSDSDRKLLETDVSIIFHAASSVRFDDPLKKAILLNVRGTRDLMELAKNFKNLEVMTYVSTLYSNTEKEVIKEMVYPSDYDWRVMINLAENMDEHILNSLQAKILVKKPNTYTFTKQLAENIIHDYSVEIPSVIFRPSIVTFTMDEPLPGWMDNLNGPVGLSVGIIMGILHVIYADESSSNDFMPCDYAIKGLIVATWCKGISDTNECQVINAASGSKKKHTISSLESLAINAIQTSPSSRMLWYPSFFVTDNRLYFYLMTFFMHLLPGALVDIAFYLKGISFSLIKMYRKIFIANRALSYFLMNDWKIITNNYNYLPKLLSNNDKDIFYYDMELLDEESALNVGLFGAKKFILKEDMGESSSASAKLHLKRMYWLYCISRILLVLLVSWIFIKLSMKYFDSII